MAPPASSVWLLWRQPRGDPSAPPPSLQTKKDDGTALTAPNSSQWVAAPAFPSASSLSLPPGTRFTNLDRGFPAPGRVLGRLAQARAESKSILLGGQVEAGILGFSGRTPATRHQNRSHPTPKLSGRLVEAESATRLAPLSPHPARELRSAPRTANPGFVFACLARLYQDARFLRGDQGRRRQRSTVARPPYANETERSA